MWCIGATGWPRSRSQFFIYSISSVCEMLMRLPMACRAGVFVRVRSRSVISTAWEWCMIMPCMKSISAAVGTRG